MADATPDLETTDAKADARPTADAKVDGAEPEKPAGEAEQTKTAETGGTKSTAKPEPDDNGGTPSPPKAPRDAASAAPETPKAREPAAQQAEEAGAGTEDDAESDGEAGTEEDTETLGDGLTTPRISNTQLEPALSIPGQPILINDRYEVHPTKPLPELDSPSARAYEAEDRLEPRSQIFALVCIPEIPARQNVINSLSGDDLQGVIKLIDSGTAEWSSLDQWCQILIFERPLGGRVLTAMTSDIQEFHKIDIIRAVLEQGTSALQYLQLRGHIHRAVRPDNLFFRDAEKEEIILGEFMTAPPGFDQPLVYETAERGMASEGGRGRGGVSDDFYALGATVAFLQQAVNPVKGMTREQLIHAKITHSSYQTLVGGNLLTSTLLEPMRGLLEDDAEQRWGFDNYDMWASGRRVPAGQAATRRRSPRPLKFGEFEHIEPKSLAYAMSLRPDTSIKLIKDGTLETWLGRGIEDKELAAVVAAQVEAAKAKEQENRDADYVLLAKVLILMDPSRPIHYKGAVFMPDGFGAAIATEMIRGGNIKDLAEAIVHQIPTFWFESQEGGLASSANEEALFQELRLNLQKTGPGFGAERCLYESNTSLACRSPLLGGRYVAHIEDLLSALDLMEKKIDSKQRPYDRHIAAFVASHINSDIDELLDQTADSDDAVVALAVLKLYASMQVTLQLKETMGLSKWLGGQMGPVIRLYKSRGTRRRLEAEVPKLVRIGWLPDLLGLLDDYDARIKDSGDYADARDEFRDADAEIE